jgi:RNA polymerase sigma factor (TIGR02999 family)
MTTAVTIDVTELLLAWNEGDQSALDQLITLVYDELYILAQKYMRLERPGHTLQAMGLINELYLRLLDLKNVDWQNRAHFLAIAAQLMRQILFDFARSSRYIKRGGGVQQVPFEETTVVSGERSPLLIALDDALQSLAMIDPRKFRIVELRYFVGLTVEETAKLLKVSTRTVTREWNLAREWLYRELSP